MGYQLSLGFTPNWAHWAVFAKDTRTAAISYAFVEQDGTVDGFDDLEQGDLLWGASQ